MAALPALQLPNTRLPGPQAQAAKSFNMKFKFTKAVPLASTVQEEQLPFELQLQLELSLRF